MTGKGSVAALDGAAELVLEGVQVRGLGHAQYPALADEVGPQWVELYDEELTPARLRHAIGDTAEIDGRPDLSRRDWDGVARAHADAYRAALASRGRR